MKHLILAAIFVLLGACHSSTTSEIPTNTAPTYQNTTPIPEPAKPDYPTAASAEPSAAGNNNLGTVHYENPNTSTTANYDLEVEYDGSGDVERIIFPSGGYIGQHHITDQTHNGDGTITITTDKGQEFTINEEEGNQEESSEDE